MKETLQEFINMNVEVDKIGNLIVAKKVPCKYAKKVLVLGDRTQQLGNVSNMQKGPLKRSQKTSGAK